MTSCCGKEESHEFCFEPVSSVLRALSMAERHKPQEHGGKPLADDLDKDIPPKAPEEQLHRASYVKLYR